MELTRLSTKGQIVIPESIRSGLPEGTAFNVIKKDNLIVLKKIEGFNEKEIMEIQEINNIWKDIDSGKGVTQSKKDFLKEIGNW